MRIGFTGTRHGMTDAQNESVRKLIEEIVFDAKGEHVYAHQGDCIGSDAEFHDLCWRVSVSDKIRRVVHPPIAKHLQACCENPYEIRLKKEYLDRNKDIVDECDILIATPAEQTEQERGGTWSTIRYASKIGRHGYIVFPDGAVVEMQAL